MMTRVTAIEQPVDTGVAAGPVAVRPLPVRRLVDRPLPVRRWSIGRCPMGQYSSSNASFGKSNCKSDEDSSDKLIWSTASGQGQ